jgi:DNA-binding CsgD family transcriptional regulator
MESTLKHSVPGAPFEPAARRPNVNRCGSTALYLTKREIEIVFLIGRGHTTKEIASILKLSMNTVGTHRKSICRKLGAHSTVELVHMILSSTSKPANVTRTQY